MRLYLSSFRLGRRPEVFGGMVRGDRRGWIVMNAMDGSGAERRRADTRDQIAQLTGLGLHAADLDLRDLTPDTVRPAVGAPDFLWLRGGNVFTLRMAMARSGLDRLVVDHLAEDRFVYAGYSAGACVLAPSLAGLERCDSTEDCRSTYGDVRFDGLGVLDRPVVPHLDSPGHPESHVLGEVADHYRAGGQEYWGLRDGEALVVDGPDVRIER